MDIESGSGGALQLPAGNTVATTDFGSVYLAAGAGGASLGGTINSGGGSVGLFSAGPVTQPAAGAIVTADLYGNAPAFDLRGAGNQIAQIGQAFGEALTATAGDVTIVNSVPLTVGGNPDSTGGGIQVPNGRTITLVADSLAIGNGALPDPASEGYLFATLYAPGGAVAVQPFTAGRAVELASGGKTAGALSVTQSELGRIVADRLQFGSETAGPLTVGSAGIPLNLGSSTGGGSQFTELDLASGGLITQAAGSPLTIPALSANGATVTLLEAGNQIATLGVSSASQGNFSIADAAPLTVSGARHLGRHHLHQRRSTRVSTAAVSPPRPCSSPR